MSRRVRDVEEQWRDLAACAPYDTRIFFPTDHNGGLYPDVVDPVAADLCATCPAFEPCLDFALHHDVEGTWAGTSYTGRRRMRRERGIRAQTLTITFDEPATDTPQENIA